MVTGMWTKYKNGEISRVEYRNYVAQNHGFKDGKEYLAYLLKQRGFNSNKECNEHLAKLRGFKNYDDYKRNYRHSTGKQKPMSNKEAKGVYLGVYIGERILSKIFQNVQRMPYNYPGYDFICSKNFRVNVKCSCYRKKYNTWQFTIDCNKDVDYYLFIAFDDINTLNPLHIWLIKSDEIIYTNISSKKLYDKKSFTIYNSSKQLEKYSKYEQIDKLEKLIECCNILKEANLE